MMRSEEFVLSLATATAIISLPMPIPLGLYSASLYEFMIPVDLLAMS